MDGVEITNADVAAARRAWQRAVAGGASEARTCLLYDDLRRVISAQAQQMADEFRLRRSREA